MRKIEKKAKSGRKSKLCIEDRLLMTLEYIGEYRTYFHIGQSYGISESNCFKIIRWIEDTLIKHQDKEIKELQEKLGSGELSEEEFARVLERLEALQNLTPTTMLQKII